MSKAFSTWLLAECQKQQTNFDMISVSAGLGPDTVRTLIRNPHLPPRSDAVNKLSSYFKVDPLSLARLAWSDR